ATEATAFAAAAFFWARVVQTVVHLAGIPYVRTAAFAVGTFAQFVIAAEILL
ncbi:MAG: MAPEG family protein, partial [Gammaproteobacteria bacterium]|nr:MAPEG family protein [Gemmatimonadota bacterium]NIU72491.1 MAPEG family protein [Gammaproteobacteria bacterium]